MSYNITKEKIRSTTKNMLVKQYSQRLEFAMELLMNTQKECQQLEVYGEYLKKIPELLKQLETVEKMYQKAVLEEAMLKDKPLDNHSVQLYAERLRRIKEQCELRSADIRQQCTLILELKSQIEAESSVLRALQS